MKHLFLLACVAFTASAVEFDSPMVADPVAPTCTEFAMSPIYIDSLPLPLLVVDEHSISAIEAEHDAEAALVLAARS